MYTNRFTTRPAVILAATALAVSGCGASYVQNPVSLPKLQPAATSATVVMSEVQYDTRVVPAKCTAFMEAFSREVFSGSSRSGLVPELVLERDALASDGRRKLIRMRITDFRETVDRNLFAGDDDVVEMKVVINIYDASGLPLKPVRTVHASVLYESNMFDTTNRPPLVIQEFGVRVQGKLYRSDNGTQRVDFSRALARDLATQLVIQAEPIIRAKLTDSR
jgi:hypothetical protein